MPNWCSDMAKSGKTKEIALGIVIILIVLALASVAGLIIRQVLNPEEKGSVIGVSYNGKAINNGDSIGILFSGAEFDVVATGDYTVTITPYHTEQNNFEFTYNGGTAKWSQVPTVAAGFTIEKKTDGLNRGFTIHYPKLDDIIEKSCGMETEGANAAMPRADILKLTLTGADEKPYEITFCLAVYAEKVTVPNIVF